MGPSVPQSLLRPWLLGESVESWQKWGESGHGWAFRAPRHATGPVGVSGLPGLAPLESSSCVVGGLESPGL